MAESCGVRIDFGRSDEGDPWCVVLDDNEDVLVHIARIDGVFVAHAVAQDLVAQASELSAALDRALGARSGDRADVVVPFPSNRSSQIVTAVLVAAAISWSSDSEAHESLPAPSVPDVDGDTSKDRRDAVTIALPVDLLVDLVRTMPASAPEPDTMTSGTSPLPAADVALHVPVTHDATVSAWPATLAPVDADAAIPLPEKPVNLVLQTVGAPAAPLPEMPSAPPTVLIVGTNDDDSLLVGASMVVSGGAGADQFVIAPPPRVSDQPLGVILDFNIGEGDTLQLMPVSSVDEGFVERTPVAYRLAPPEAGPAASILSVDAVADVRPDATVGASPVAGVRLGVDLDADGHEDAFLLVGGVNEMDAAHLFGLPITDSPALSAGHDTHMPAPPPVHDTDMPAMATMLPEPDLAAATTFLG